MHLVLTTILMLTASPAPQGGPPTCPRDAEPVSAAFADWTAPDVVKSGAVEGGSPVQPGKAVDLTLHPQTEVTLAVQPGRAGMAGHHAGLVQLRITSPGTYKLALGVGAWVDVVRDGTAIVSTDHGHGPACSGIRKIVDFPLTPGEYVVQISASPASTVRMLVAAQ